MFKLLRRAQISTKLVFKLPVRTLFQSAAVLF